VPEYGYTELIPIEGCGADHYKIVSTGFWNKGMPLIRYDIGDVVYKPDGCSCNCGREFVVVESVIGKEADVIRSPSGVQLGVTAVMQILYTIGGTNNVLETQFVQDSLDHVTVEYVPGPNFSEEDLVNMKNCAVKFLPGDLRVDFKQVEAVKRTPMGKIRAIVSQISE
jgi:phenylacetate-CoA ligase